VKKTTFFCILLKMGIFPQITLIMLNKIRTISGRGNLPQSRISQKSKRIMGPSLNPQRGLATSLFMGPSLNPQRGLATSLFMGPSLNPQRGLAASLFMGPN
jgi:hypothetical protein